MIGLNGVKDEVIILKDEVSKLKKALFYLALMSFTAFFGLLITVALLIKTQEKLGTYISLANKELAGKHQKLENMSSEYQLWAAEERQRMDNALHCIDMGLPLAECSTYRD